MQTPTASTHHKPSLTTAHINDWFKAALADPARKVALRQDWRKLLLAEITATPEQKASLEALPQADAKELQTAIAQTVDHGGTIHIDRSGDTGPGRLVVQPNMQGGEHANFSFGIFHCTFDAYFQHWHCGWGPG